MALQPVTPRTTSLHPDRFISRLIFPGSLVAAILSPFAACDKNESQAPAPVVTSRISVGNGGIEATGGISGVPAVSADGRYISFASDAANLVVPDANGHTDVFVHDSLTGQTTRVSVNSAGLEASGGGSRNPAISGDGRFVAFESDANNLVANDTNGIADIFLHDRSNGQTTRISIDNSGNQATTIGSFGPAISSNGQQIAYTSGAPNLVLGDTNGLTDIFVRDQTAGVTTRVSVASGGIQAIGPAGSINPTLNDNGQYVAFASAATNLVANDTNNQYDVFLFDRLTGETSRISVDSSGSQAVGGPSDNPSISADGRYVAFQSSATNLIPNDGNNSGDVFVRDRSGGQTTRTSVGINGAEGNGISTVRNGGISADGRFIAFQSAAGNLIADDVNNLVDIFVHDRTTGQTTRQSVTSAGVEGLGGDSSNPVISGNGLLVAFDSFATNLVPNDTNNLLDVFLATRR